MVTHSSVFAWRIPGTAEPGGLLTMGSHRVGHDYGHHQMVNNEIRLIIFYAAKDGEALYSQQKQDQELTVAHHELLITKFSSLYFLIMFSLLDSTQK